MFARNIATLLSASILLRASIHTFCLLAQIKASSFKQSDEKDLVNTWPRLASQTVLPSLLKNVTLNTTCTRLIAHATLCKSSTSLSVGLTHPHEVAGRLRAGH
ncbi:hypothetical protein B0H14DRAFT_2819219 [Mycena olivaceomarginata]|nr:hypothetical protein B0H14DRAFT_2819219 [Mycena olivaceomarginata]